MLGKTLLFSAVFWINRSVLLLYIDGVLLPHPPLPSKCKGQKVFFVIWIKKIKAQYIVYVLMRSGYTVSCFTP